MEWMLLPLRRYFEFSGRSQRKEYWMFTLFLILAQVPAAILDAIIGYGGRDSGPVSTILSLATAFPAFSVGVRRMHDVDRSGWWLFSPLLALVPLVIGYAIGSNGGVGTIFLIITACVGIGLAILVFVWTVTDGTTGGNRYGPDPKGGSRENMEEIFR